MVGALTTTYLGLPMVAKSQIKSSVEGNVLSKEGRLTLMKSTISNFPVYGLAFYASSDVAGFDSP